MQRRETRMGARQKSNVRTSIFRRRLAILASAGALGLALACAAKTAKADDEPRQAKPEIFFNFLILLS